MIKTKKLKGFTLVELVVVIAIIGVLTAIVVPNIVSYFRTSKIQEANSNAEMIHRAASDYLTALEMSGEKGAAEKYFGAAEVTVGSDKIHEGFLMVDFDKRKHPTAPNEIKEEDVIAYGASSLDYAMRAANAIQERASYDLTGCWLVSVYPDTYTVRYVVYSGENANTKSAANVISSAKLNSSADPATYNTYGVAYVGAPISANSSGNAPYLYQKIFGGKNDPSDASEKFSQEMHTINDSELAYIGLFPVPAK